MLTFDLRGMFGASCARCVLERPSPKRGLAVLSLQTDNLSMHFGGLKAVDNLTMNVPAGKITGLIGPNGAGKSTVVNMIAGALSLTHGTIRLGAYVLYLVKVVFSGPSPEIAGNPKVIESYLGS